jgi:adenosylcobinamide-GDP ribazoletransferase
MFTAVPVRAPVELKPRDGVSALLWLPLVGGLTGAFAALPLVAILHWAPHAAALGAVLAVGLMAALTRGLHLDGLADTADGLGSRAPAERALQIMRQSDIGPFGVIALIVVLAADITALAVTRDGDWFPLLALAVAAATGRVAAVCAAMRGVPPARTSGFGAIVADGISPVAVAGWILAVLGVGVTLAAASGTPIAWILGPQCAALVVAHVARLHVVRRVGGMTGDVFGALIEIGTAVTLVGMALR